MAGRVNRLDSVSNEDDLFGPGQVNNPIENEHSNPSNATESNISLPSEGQSDIDQQVAIGQLPFLSLFDSPSVSSKTSDPGSEGKPTSPTSAGDGSSHTADNSSDHRNVFLTKRSISAMDRRKDYINSTHDNFCNTVFFNDDVPPASLSSAGPIRSNSLPDLVPNSGESLSPQSSYPDVASSKQVEDTINEGQLISRKLHKEAIEGKSVYNASSHEKFRRSVSINEEANRYIEAPEACTEMPGSCTGVSSTVAIVPEHGGKTNKGDIKLPSLKSPKSPTPSLKQLKTSRDQIQSNTTSGYQTGGSECGASQEKVFVSQSSQNSQGGVSEVSSTYWDSQEGNENGHAIVTGTDNKSELKDSNSVGNQEYEQPEGNLVLFGSLSGIPSYNDAVPPYSGEEDVGYGSIRSSIEDSCRTDSSGTIGRSTSSSYRTVIDTMDGGGQSEDITKQPYAMVQLSNVNNAKGVVNLSPGNEKRKHPKVELKSSEVSNLGPPYQQGTILQNTHAMPPPEKSVDGNLPTFLDSNSTMSSFSLPQAQVNKVIKAEEKQYEKLRKRLDSKESLPGPLSATSATESPSMSSPMSAGSKDYAMYKYQHMQMMHLQQWENLVTSKSPTEIIDNYQPPSICSPSLRSLQECRKVCHEQNFTAEDFIKSARCNVTNCAESCCKKLASIHMIMSYDLPDTHIGFGLVKKYCQLLWEHSQDCDDELVCPVLHCTDIVKSWGIRDTGNDDDLVKQMLPQIQHHVYKPHMTCFLNEASKFHKLDRNDETMEPKEFMTHVPLFTLGKFGSAVACMDQQLNAMCLIKTYPPLDYKHHMSLYKGRLCDVQHKHLVKHIWLLEYSEVVQVCTQFMSGGSLQDILRSAGPLPWQHVVHYMVQILDGISFLHSRGVVYLNWQSKNMLFGNSQRYDVKVGNLGLSCPMQSQMDTGAVKQCVPAYLCPPEMIDHNIDFLCDSWGAGCLLYELATGFPVLHKYRHESRDTVYTLIKGGNIQAPDSLTVVQRNVFTFCWKANPKERKSLEKISSYLASISAL